MPIACGYCGATMPDISEFCPSCGRPVREGNFFAPDPVVEAAEAPEEVLPPVPRNDRLVGALAYLTFIPALLFIFQKQYQQRTFVRFHAFQSVFFWAVVVALLVIGVLASTFGWLLMWMLTGALVLLAIFFTWAVLWIKALQGEWFELPVLGALAEQQAGRS